VKVDYEAGSVTIYWRGEPPPAVSRLHGKVIDGVSVSLVTSMYSEVDMVVAGTRAHRYLDSVYGSGTFASAGPTEDWTALRVSIVGPWSGSISELEHQVNMPVLIRLIDEDQAPVAL